MNNCSNFQLDPKMGSGRKILQKNTPRQTESVHISSVKATKKFIHKLLEISLQQVNLLLFLLLDIFYFFCMQIFLIISTEIENVILKSCDGMFRNRNVKSGFKIVTELAVSKLTNICLTKSKIQSTTSFRNR